MDVLMYTDCIQTRLAVVVLGASDIVRKCMARNFPTSCARAMVRDFILILPTPCWGVRAASIGARQLRGGVDTLVQPLADAVFEPVIDDEYDLSEADRAFIDMQTRIASASSLYIHSVQQWDDLTSRRIDAQGR